MENEERITYFAETDYRNKKTAFGIKARDRTRHMYVIGKTGMGKSTVLENMAIQDIQNGEGMAIIDPHGSTAEKLLDYVPEHRIKDVVYFAPFDTDYPLSFNVMEDVGKDKRHLVASGLMSTFKKIWADAWSARMEYILTNTLLALLEYPDATLLGVNKMLSDKEYRKKVVDNITDPSVRSFWVDEFAKYTDKFAAEATPAIQNKVGQFTSNPIIRNIIGQPKSSFDLRQVMDEKKILIINLSKGLVGEQNASLLGGMLITKIYLGAMSRADVPPEQLAKLPNFYFYVDEFQSFANASFADILSEARKYKLNLTIAHQYVEQMAEEVRAAVFGNVGTMAVFRVGATDAELFEKEFAPMFTAEDIVNLGQYQMYLKLMINGVGSKPFSARGLPPLGRPDISFKSQIIEFSRKFNSRNREEVEKEITSSLESKPAVKAIPSLDKTEYKKDYPPKEKFDSKTRNFSNNERVDNRNNYNKPFQKEFVKKKYEEPLTIKEKFEEKKTIEIKKVHHVPSLKLQEFLDKLEGEDTIPPATIVEEKKEIQPAPLNILKKHTKDAKAPSKENMSALKDVLAKVISNNKIENKNVEEKIVTPKIKNVEDDIKKEDNIKEVPENVLRQILETDKT